MLYIYPACFFKEKDGYSVVFPDLNWLATSGKTESEAMSKAVECLTSRMHMLIQDGESIPEASQMSDISIELIAEEFEANTEGSFINMVPVDVNSKASDLGISCLTEYNEAETMQMFMEEGREKGKIEGLIEGKILAYFDTGMKEPEIATKTGQTIDFVKDTLKANGLGNA